MNSTQKTSGLSEAIYENLKSGHYHCEKTSLFGERKIKFDGIETEYNMNTLFKELVTEEPTPDNLEKLKLFKQIDTKTSNFLMDIYYKVFGGRRKELDLAKEHALGKLETQVTGISANIRSNNGEIDVLIKELAKLMEKKVKYHQSDKNESLAEITKAINKCETELKTLKDANKSLLTQQTELKDLGIKYKTIE